MTHGHWSVSSLTVLLNEGTRSAKDKLERSSKQRSSGNGTHLGRGGDSSSRQTRMASDCGPIRHRRGTNQVKSSHFWMSKIWQRMWYVTYRQDCNIYSQTTHCPFPKVHLSLRGIWTFHLMHCTLGPPGSTFQTAPRSVQPFLRTHGRDQQTDRKIDWQTTLRFQSNVFLPWNTWLTQKICRHIDMQDHTFHHHSCISNAPVTLLNKSMPYSQNSKKQN